MIKVENFSKKFGKFELKNISTEISEGYICGLVGRNGAGKTCLIHSVLGLCKGDSGFVKVDDLDYEKEEKKIRDQIGVVLNEDLFRPGVSVKENAKRYGAYYSKYSSESFLSYLKEFKINPQISFGKLSRGQKLKVQFAFALAINPKYLIMDEPTANFDPEFKKIFNTRIREFVSDGKRAVLLSTQITDDLERNADYLIYLDEGSVLFSGDIESFRDSYRIVHGEKDKLNHIYKKFIVSVDEREYTCKALIKFEKDMELADGLVIERPTIEEFMYMFSRREKK